MKRWRWLAALAALGALLVLVMGTAGHAGPPMNYHHLNKIQKRLASGVFTEMLAPQATDVGPEANPDAVIGGGGGDEEGDENDALAPPDAYGAPVGGSSPSDQSSYFPKGSDACRQTLGNNTKVNQNCLNISDPDLAGRGQSQNETSIAIDPSDPNHMIASYNDYRRGDGNCYGAYSLDKGRTWNDTTIPMSFTRGQFANSAREYWQAGGDTSVAWDTKGNV
jgi:hypothetical protein